MQAATDSRPLDPETWVDEHGDYLFRYALARVHDPERAEDLVQETFLSALEGADRFRGRSSLRTWLVGILKHKIVDHIRRRSRERAASDVEAGAETVEDLYDERGHWKEGPGLWPQDPQAVLENKEFWAAFHHCMFELPSRLADAFTLRELEGLSGEEVCKVLDVTPTNLWVMMYRARMHLRRCLEMNWFRSEGVEKR